MLKELGKDIWTMNGPNVVFAGASMHTRMTVVKLSTNSLWVHSPIAYSPEVASVIAGLGGSVDALVAPNKFHHLYLPEWERAHPNAQVFAEPELMRKIASLQHATPLSDAPPALYASDIDQTLFTGNRLFQEAVFFHRKSRTLILTDLMINLPADGLKWLPKLFLRFEGALFPNGGVPRLYRLFTRDKAQARASLAVIRAWAPERVTFCHGEAFSETAAELIDQQFRWLDSP